jgi:hypothetical protein
MQRLVISLIPAARPGARPRSKLAEGAIIHPCARAAGYGSANSSKGAGTMHDALSGAARERGAPTVPGRCGRFGERDPHMHEKIVSCRQAAGRGLTRRAPLITAYESDAASNTCTRARPVWWCAVVSIDLWPTCTGTSDPPRGRPAQGQFALDAYAPGTASFVLCSSNVTLAGKVSSRKQSLLLRPVRASRSTRYIPRQCGRVHPRPVPGMHATSSNAVRVPPD